MKIDYSFIEASIESKLNKIWEKLHELGEQIDSLQNDDEKEKGNG